MSLHATARESNIIDSLKKYFIDNLFSQSDSIPLGFDGTISVPEVQGSPSKVRRWVKFDWGTLDIDTLSTFTFDIIACTRKDTEGHVLAQLRDKIVELLTDHENNYTDGMARIPWYQSNPGSTDTWTSLGAFVIQDMTESRRFTAPDGTKYKIIVPRLRFASKA